jgi:rhamnogalacturonyl hydrolase YesR
LTSHFDKETVNVSLARLESWLKVHDWQGYEPFDGLNSWLRPLAFNKLIRQILVQIGVRSPINLRPILGIRPATSTKGIGYIARAYLELHRLTGDVSHLSTADRHLNWLREHANRKDTGVGWGNHFDYQTRGYYLPKGEPTVVWTSLVGHAFIDAYELVKRPVDLEEAVQAAQFITKGLERRPQSSGVCISYVPGTFLAIHNANMLAAGFLSRVYRHTQDNSYRETAKDAVLYTASAQRPDGSWWYGEEPRFRWVDNWHTAYVLDSLWRYMENTGDRIFAEQFEKGVRFWLDHFFLDEGTPNFYPNRTYPIDIQSASQAIESLCLYSRVFDAGCASLANKVADWTIAHMQDQDGHFYYRRTPHWVNRTPMFHWGQATMFYALVSLVGLNWEKSH